MKQSFFHSLRFRLIALTLIVEVVMLTLLIGNSLRLVDEQVKYQLLSEQVNLNQLIVNSINTALFERDYSSMQSALETLINNENLTNPILHIHVFDNDEKVFISVGSHFDEDPALQTDINQLDYNYEHLQHQAGITLGGTQIGSVEYVISIKHSILFRKQLLTQATTIAAIEILLSMALLIFLGLWLTRNLSTLISGTKEIARGKYDIDLHINSQDEIGQLADSMQIMSREISRHTQDLQKSHDQLSAIANYSYSCEIWLNNDGTLKWVNPSAQRLVGYDLQEIKAMKHFPLDIVNLSDREQLQQNFKKSLESHLNECRDFRINHKDGHEIWVAVVCQPVHNLHGKKIGLRASIIDISERVAMEEALKGSLLNLQQSHETQQQLLDNSNSEQARLRSLLTSMNVGILFENTANEVDYYNPAFLRIWTIDEDQVYPGIKTQEILQHSTNVISHHDHLSKHILDVESTHESSESYEILTADGRTIHQLSYPVINEQNAYIGRIWMYEDITRQKQTAEQLLYLAERDHLTGLYNRRRFQQELEKRMQENKRNEKMFALLFFDLDEFKLINDTFGHRAGDSVLIRISGELSTLIRSDVFLSRLGGDEFGILAPVGKEQEAKVLAERIIQAIASLPFRFEGNNLRITTSIGIAVYPQHGTSVDELVAHSDTAMYAAKQRGKNTCRLFEPGMMDSTSMTKQLTWNERIINALDNNRFVLHYQAVQDIQQGLVSHYELLIRMRDDKHPDNLIMPGNFIPVAEKSGKIMLIDQWVVKRAITLLAENDDIPALAVNISGRSMDDPTLAHNISDWLSENQVDAHRLIVELTETAAVSDLADAQRFIEHMHRTGCQVYLDDFGAGFSTFAYLKHINADSLKFDGQFIVNLSNDHENQIFVKSMVTIAKGLGKKTVAEFVEDADTLELLKELGVDMAQGYHVHKPSENILH